MVLLKLLEELATEGGQGEKENKDEEGADGIRPAVAGGAFLCSVPPSGNGPMTKRFIKQVCRIVVAGWGGSVEVDTVQQ